MADYLTDFHFIRSDWLYAMILVIVALIGLLLTQNRKNSWYKVIDKHLLNHLLKGSEIGKRNIIKKYFSHIFMIGLSLVLMVLALAGPSWEKRPLPVFESEISKVILLDLSLSMNATDIKPNRLTRAKHKIIDLLNKTSEGQIALIVYAGDAFVISPLTTDAKTIETLIPPLEPAIMPVLGSEPINAFNQADQLLENAGVFSGQIIWITDGIDNNDYLKVSKYLESSRHQISILAVGTPEGAPIPLPDGQGFLKNSNGSIVVPTLQVSSLKQLAESHNGNLTMLTADDTDIQRLIQSLKPPEEFIAGDDDLKMDSWIEFGPWLLLPVLLIVAFAFRKGLVIVLLFSLLPMRSDQSFAASPNPASEDKAIEHSEGANSSVTSSLQKTWNNLWYTPDQQAKQAFEQSQLDKAAELFERADWKAAAQYKSGQYHAATDALSSFKDADSLYNKANALAKAGRLEESIKAYDEALTKSPDMEDAKFNKELVEKLLKQQQEQQKNQKNDQDQNKDQQQNQDSDQQEGEQEKSEQDQEQQEQSEQEQSDQDHKQDDSQEQSEQQSELDKMSEAEKEQELEQWLRMIKDDPGGLLRRKMYMEYQKRQQQGKDQQNKGEQVW